jgi:hypothetical protein
MMMELSQCKLIIVGSCVRKVKLKTIYIQFCPESTWEAVCHHALYQAYHLQFFHCEFNHFQRGKVSLTAAVCEVYEKIETVFGNQAHVYPSDSRKHDYEHANPAHYNAFD